MATCKLFLDNSSVKADGTCAVKICICHQRRQCFIHQKIFVKPGEWSPSMQMIQQNPKKKVLNALLHERLNRVDDMLIDLRMSGRLNKMTPKQVRDYCADLLEEASVTDIRGEVQRCFEEFMELKKTRTREIYFETVRKIQSYVGKKRYATLAFADLNLRWLNQFSRFMQNQGLKPNAIGIHMRNIRAVFNYAIDNDVTTLYPFRRFRIKYERTKHRALTIEQLRALWNLPLEGHLAKYRDLFFIIFMLRGINCADLAMLKKVQGGRIFYKRAKTGKEYDVKVEPEALALMNRYKGKKYLLYPMDSVSDYRNWSMKLNKALKVIASKIDDMPPLTTYWARHSWASVAAELDIPKETIAQGLGHGGFTVTDIYIDFNQKKVDEANRRVLDFLFEK